jgi:probable HAF family extracellular repeat protein
MYSIQELTSYEGSGGIGLNNNGDAVGYANDDPVYSYVLAAIWFSSGGKYVAPHITDASNLNAINSYGVAVGFLGFPGTWTTHAMMVKDGLLTDLTSIPSAQMSGEAYAINSSGIVCADGGLLVNVASTPMTATPMPAFAGYDTLIPFTINDEGDVAGACSQDGAPEHGFLYRNGSYWDLGPNDEGDFCLNNNRTLVGSIPSPVLAPAVWQWGRIRLRADAKHATFAARICIGLPLRDQRFWHDGRSGQRQFASLFESVHLQRDELDGP